ncbi:ABC transporter permease [Synergistaceae bacterium OttesenSCG-928-I11]|nr:ABC transporter permease [Synergistaceae bacterium OttesenSCG-928-I11]
MLNRLLNLVKKEFLTLLQDRQSRIQLVAMPVLMLFVFSFAMTMEVKNASLGILNEDEGDLGVRFVRAFQPGPTYSRIVTFRSPSEIRRAVDTQEVLMALHIPRDFSKNLMSGVPAPVQAILDGRKSNAAQIVSGYASLVATSFTEELYANRTTGAVMPNVETRFLFNPNLEFSWFNQPMLLILLTQMIVLLITGMSIAKERELGTFEQLLVSPLSPIEIVAGKTVPGIFLGLAEGLFIFVMSTTVFHVPFVGSHALLFWMMLLFILSTSAIGLAISSVCSTQQQAFLGTSLFMVPSMLLSGFVAPVENMPTALQWMTQLNPTKHTLKAVMGIYLKDLSPLDLSTEMAWMFGIAAGSLLLASWFFKRHAQ